MYVVNDGESMGNIIGTVFPGWFVDDVFPHIFQAPGSLFGIDFGVAIMEGPNAGMVETRWIRLSCLKLYFDQKRGDLMEFSAIIHRGCHVEMPL